MNDQTDNRVTPTFDMEENTLYCSGGRQQGDSRHDAGRA